MSLLREIQDSATSSTVKLTDVLRKAKILAVRLGHDAFKKWVEQELNGYPSRNDLPKYRVLTVQSFGDFSGPFGSGLRNYPIPDACLPEKYREHATKAYLSSGISYYEELVQKATPSNPLQSPWDANLTAIVGENIYEGMNCVHAWQRIPSGAIVSLLDTVRNKILDFALEIEAQAPDAGEASPGTNPVPQETVGHIFNTYITGGSNVIAGNVNHATQLHVVAGDLESLKKYLATAGLDEGDIRELEAAVRADPPQPDSQKLGTRVSAWMGKIVSKAASGALGIATKVAVDVISRGIRSYYGLGA